MVWNNDVRFLGGVSSRFVLIVIVPLDGWVSCFHLNSIKGPCRVFTIG